MQAKEILLLLPQLSKRLPQWMNAQAKYEVDVQWENGDQVPVLPTYRNLFNCHQCSQALVAHPNTPPKLCQRVALKKFQAAATAK